MELTLAQRKAATKAQLARWPKATKQEKSQILDAICEVTGWHRDHARKVIRQMFACPDPAPRKPREPVTTYDDWAIALLEQYWALSGAMSGKRLKVALPGLIDNLARHGHLDQPGSNVIEQVLAMSPATIDRRLAPARALMLPTRAISHTRPGSLLKTSIPLKTWAQWNDTIPGLLQIELVGHEGGDNNGAFHFSLHAVEVATGWTEVISIHSKGERVVTTALDQLRARFPFHIAGIHSDNGSEFINHHLMRWAARHHITMTRGRPARSNDQAHVEHRNWSIVRRNVGYWRYDTTRELDLLNQLWPMICLQANLFHPQQRLISKTRQGARIIKRHDDPQSSWDRLQTRWPDLLDPHDHARLQAVQQDTDLLQTQRAIHLLQANLLELARRRGQVQRRAKTNHVYLSKTKMTTRKRAS